MTLLTSSPSTGHNTATPMRSLACTPTLTGNSGCAACSPARSLLPSSTPRPAARSPSSNNGGSRTWKASSRDRFPAAATTFPIACESAGNMGYRRPMIRIASGPFSARWMSGCSPKARTCAPSSASAPTFVKSTGLSEPPLPSGHPMRNESVSLATLTLGTVVGTRCACAANVASGRSSCPASRPAPITSSKSARATVTCCR